MKIVLFHPAALPPPDYGGIERVVLWLAEGLRDHGHEVWVAALGGSRLPEGVRLIEISPDRCSAHDLIPLLPAGVDVVHFMAPPEENALESLPCAGLLTVHGNGKPGEVFPRNTAFLSHDHARRHHASVFVHNGLNPAEYRFAPGEKSGRYLFLSKTSWKVKNVRGAVRFCSRAGVPLDVTGGRRPYGTRVRCAFSRGLRWVGPVGGALKAQYLARAKALVFPVLWDEPFGLVVIEAMISGTPVLASRRGSLPELVTTPAVGKLLDPTDEIAWIETLRDPPRAWDPDACRAHALEHFHFHLMAKNYEILYRRVSGGEFLHPKEPHV